MTNKEAIDDLKFVKETNILKHLHMGNEALDLAVKALEILDDVNHKVYRNENCPQKHKCYDYQGYHCAGCSWEKKGSAE